MFICVSGHVSGGVTCSSQSYQLLSVAHFCSHPGLSINILQIGQTDPKVHVCIKQPHFCGLRFFSQGKSIWITRGLMSWDLFVSFDTVFKLIQLKSRGLICCFWWIVQLCMFILLNNNKVTKWYDLFKIYILCCIYACFVII